MNWQEQREALRQRLKEQIALLEQQERTEERDRLLEGFRKSLAEVERG